VAAPAPDLHFERIYRLHARDVYRFALAVVRNPTEAEDVTQTTFLNAYRALKRGESPERPRSWLFAIAHNAIRSRHRWTLRRPREVPLEAAAYRLAVPPDERENVTAVLKALGELPQNQREALAMRELEGFSYGEIAETLGVSVTAVESLLSRGRRTLRMQRAKLRSLVVLGLPQSVRSLLEQGGGGLAAKAAAVVAAATAVAGGIGVATHEGVASRPDRPLPTAFALLPVRSHAPSPQRAAVAPIAAAAPRQTERRARVPRTDDAPGGTAASSMQARPTSAPAPARVPTPAAATTTVAETVATTTAALPAVTVPAVTAPTVHIADVTLPVATVPSVTVTVPDLPAPPPVTTPQGTLPPGIK
jgi:RNA polymerase sigma-70 factor (ECF subfamily)